MIAKCKQNALENFKLPPCKNYKIDILEKVRLEILNYKKYYEQYNCRK